MTLRETLPNSARRRQEAASEYIGVTFLPRYKPLAVGEDFGLAAS